MGYREVSKGKIWKNEKGYMTVEAAFWMPAIALLLVMLITLCGYLYQGCFMMQMAYVAAFRGSRIENAALRDSGTYEQLNTLEREAVLSFEETQKNVEAGALSVKVTLQKETPLLGPDGVKLAIERTQNALCLDPVAYIRGIQFLQKTGEDRQ